MLDPCDEIDSNLAIIGDEWAILDPGLLNFAVLENDIQL